MVMLVLKDLAILNLSLMDKIRKLWFLVNIEEIASTMLRESVKIEASVMSLDRTKSMQWSRAKASPVKIEAEECFK